MSSMARPALPLAVATGVGTFAWYALPGAVASRPARAVAKTALAAGVTGVYALTRPRTEATNGPDRVDELLHEANAHPVQALAIATAGVGAGAAITALGERAMYRWGERRRAAGRRWPFGVPALLAAVVATVGVLADPPRA
ncbi:hypothetical protein [Propioniciclava flava]|nr:hypothetical protein [Propioniciclava flava]